MALDPKSGSFHPFERKGFAAFLEARHADPEVAPQEFAPDYPPQANEYWNRVKEYLAGNIPTLTARRPDRDESPRNLKTEESSHPKKIGRFHIKTVIASGGMGTVFQAVQENPRRTVAVKVLKAGFASPSALRRFQYESQILARLRHPGIAQVFEAGFHRSDLGNLPYFAMEYVQGANPITTFVEKRRLELRARLRLFMEVCEALNHGHQKGIIHRDLKPDNILVDSAGQVKIIDFGVARCTDSDLAVTTLQTDLGQLIGTIQYMSPEQCEGDPHSIDLRSDIYSLGVLLYELMCGQLPYHVSGKPLHEAARLIQEKEPTKISALRPDLSADAEAIVGKALSKSRDQRYQTALELRSDLDDLLRGNPVSAQAPTMIYRLRLFGRRNRGWLATAGVVILAFVVVFAVFIRALVISEARAKRELDRVRSDYAALQEQLAERERDQVGHGP